MDDGDDNLGAISLSDGTPVAREPDDASDWPLTAEAVPALLAKIIG